MTRGMLVTVGLLFIIVTCTGCSDKDSVNESMNNIEGSVQEDIIEDTEKTDNTETQTTSEPTQKLQPPRTKKELEDALGTVDEQGEWTPPEGSHVDPKTGNIINKDGVVVGTTQKPYYKARPGSQG